MTIIKTFELEDQKTDQKWKTKKLGVLIGLFLVFLVILEIWANNTLITYGEKFEKISVLQTTLQLENQVLENRIAKESALNNIATVSSTLGLASPKSIQYLH